MTKSHSSALIRIEPLAKRPEYVPGLATLLHDEWGHLPNWSNLAALARELKSRAQMKAAPFALVALDGENLVGSASIKLKELAHHRDKEFWVGDVIVAPAYRGKGVGDRLMEGIVEFAHKLEITDLYLYTPDKEAYYAKRGWRTIGSDPANGENNVVMCFKGSRY